MWLVDWYSDFEFYIVVKYCVKIYLVQLQNIEEFFYLFYYLFIDIILDGVLCFQNLIEVIEVWINFNKEEREVFVELFRISLKEIGENVYIYLIGKELFCIYLLVVFLYCVEDDFISVSG